MRFILKGKAYELRKEEVEEKMQRVTPEVIRKHYVVIIEMKFPPKQVLGEILDLGRVEFTSMDAVNILKRLGFEMGHYKL